MILRARAANPDLDVIARAHSDAEVDHLSGLGANTVIMGEREIARGIIEQMERGTVEPKLPDEERRSPTRLRSRRRSLPRGEVPNAKRGRASASPLDGLEHCRTPSRGADQPREGSPLKRAGRR